VQRAALRGGTGRRERRYPREHYEHLLREWLSQPLRATETIAEYEEYRRDIQRRDIRCAGPADRQADHLGDRVELDLRRRLSAGAV
jgi:hypothetical protein